MTKNEQKIKLLHEREFIRERIREIKKDLKWGSPREKDTLLKQLAASESKEKQITLEIKLL